MKFEKKKLPEILFFQEGPGVRKYQFTNNGVKLLNGGNINNNNLDLSTTDKFISFDEAYGRYKHFLVDEGDLVIASSGVVVSKFDGKIAFVSKENLPLCMNTSTIRFKNLSEDIDLRYVYFFLKSKLFKSQIQRLITGSAQLNFGPSHLKKIFISYPQIEDQIRIAAILTKAEELIAKRKKSIEHLDELLKSTFLEMFGDPVRNEKGWEIVKIESLGTIQRGKSKHRPRNAPELLGGKYPLIQTGDVSNAGLYITSYSQTYSEIGIAQSKMWKKGTLCITIAANIARTAILSFDSCFPDSIVGFIANEEVFAIYVHFLFGFFQRILEQNAPQAAQKNINLDTIRKLQIPKPPKNLIIQFAKIVEKVEKIKKKYEISLQELENLYGSLSQRAFKGELNLEKMQIAIEEPKQVEKVEKPVTIEKKKKINWQAIADATILAAGGIALGYLIHDLIDSIEKSKKQEEFSEEKLKELLTKDKLKEFLQNVPGCHTFDQIWFSVKKIDDTLLQVLNYSNSEWEVMFKKVFQELFIELLEDGFIEQVFEEMLINGDFNQKQNKVKQIAFRVNNEIT
jgi:type I restriction enzyme S subunit